MTLFARWWVCCVLMSGACAVAPRPATPPKPNQPAPTPKLAYQVDFRRVFGGHSSTSLYDFRVVDQTLMARVMVETELLSNVDQKTMEPWLRRRLLEAMGGRGSMLVASPLAPGVDPRHPCPAGGCYIPAPTAVLRHARFVSSKDGVSVRVHPPEGDRVVVSLWDDPDAPSVCGSDYKLTVGFVELQGVLHRLLDGAVAANIEELALVEPPPKPDLTVRAPDATLDPAAFCSVLRIAFETQRDFAFSDHRYDTAAHTVLNAALLPLYPKPAAAPP